MPRDNDEDEPVTVSPLDDLESLRDWSSSFNGPFQTKPLARRNLKNDGVANKPKTLVCHDMAGGYHDDRFVNGTADCDGYIFSYWDMVDIFVYFSHHFVTIPPICWTNAAHLHGVPVLGTIISEFSDGSKLWRQFFLMSEDEESTLVRKLCEIMIHFGFDGWLFNVENPIERDNIPRLVEFVAKLRRATKEIRGDSGWVIWYDSVTELGELMWQNALTSKNRCFFDVSDGIFLNYTWKPDVHLDGSVLLADHRKADVFVGVDVFGRGCYGGGGWNSHVAVEEAWKRGLSVAVFAQGWVYEKFQRKNLLENQKRFWERIKAIRSKLAAQQDPQEPVSKKLCTLTADSPVTDHGECQLVCDLPFNTNFDHGRGKFQWINGRNSGEKYGFRMHQQQIQAVIPDAAGVRGYCRNWVDYLLCECVLPSSLDTQFDLDIDEDDAFQGGSSQVLTWSRLSNEVQSVVFMPYQWECKKSVTNPSPEQGSMELYLIFVSKRFSQERREVFDFKLTLISEGSTIVHLVTAGHLEGVELPNDTHRPQVFNNAEEAKQRLRDFQVTPNEDDLIEIDSDGIVLINGWEIRTYILHSAKKISYRNLSIVPSSLSGTCERAAWLKLGLFAMHTVEKEGS